MRVITTLAVVVLTATLTHAQATLDDLKVALGYNSWPGKDNNVRAGCKVTIADFAASLVISNLLEPDEDPIVSSPVVRSELMASGVTKRWTVEYETAGETLSIALTVFKESPATTQEALIRWMMMDTKGIRASSMPQSQQFGDVTIRRTDSELLFCRDNVLVDLTASFSDSVASLDPLALALDSRIVQSTVTTVELLPTFLPTLSGNICQNGEVSLSDPIKDLDFQWSDPNQGNVVVEEVGIKNASTDSGIFKRKGEYLFFADGAAGNSEEVAIRFHTDHLLTGSVTTTVAIVP